MSTRRKGPVMVGDDQPVFRAADVARMLNADGETLRTVGAVIGVSAAGVHRLMRDCGYRQLWVTVAGACIRCGAPNGGGYITPGCDTCDAEAYFRGLS